MLYRLQVTIDTLQNFVWRPLFVTRLARVEGGQVVGQVSCVRSGQCSNLDALEIGNKNAKWPRHRLKNAIS